jgi:hypothetical protein
MRTKSLCKEVRPMRYPVLIALLFACLCAANSSPEKSPLVGRWRTQQGSTVEFRANGKVSLRSENRSGEALYRMPSPTQIEFLRSGQDQAYDRWEVLSVSATTLRAKNSEGKKESLTRVP